MNTPKRSSISRLGWLFIVIFTVGISLSVVLIINSLTQDKDCNGIVQSQVDEIEMMQIVEELAQKTYYKNTSAEKICLPEIHKIFTNFSTFRMWGSDKYYPYPLGNIVLVDVRDGEVFVLPRQFNDAIRKEDYAVNGNKNALMISKAYIVGESSGWEFLDSYEDVPWKKRPDHALNPKDFKQIIKSPFVKKEGNQYYVGLFTWYPSGGEIRNWQLQIGMNGEIVTADSVSVASEVGDFTQSYYK
jgi:hypothetical protein